MPLFTDQFKVLRRVTLDDTGAVVIGDFSNSPYFEAELTPPRFKLVRRPSSPQELGMWTMMYWKSVVSFYPDALQAGDRIQARGNDWEVLSDAKDILQGMQSGVQMTQVLPLTILYPFVFELQELGGATVREDVRAALWDPDERHQPTGTYRDYEGQCGIEHADVVQANRQLTIGEVSYKITTAEVDLTAKRVNLGLRLAGIKAA